MKCNFLVATVVLPSALFFWPSALDAQKQKERDNLDRILAARFVFFEDQTGAAAVGRNAMTELKKWRRIEIVSDKTKADLILVLSADSPKNGSVIVSGGQTGTVSGGDLHLDPYPNYKKSAPVRWASLDVFDATTGERLWSDSHQWGGLLTGFNSAGALLVRKLRRQAKK